MEDQEIIRRIIKCTGFKVLPTAVAYSAHRYRESGTCRLQLIFLVIRPLYYLRLPQQKPIIIYNKLIKKTKLKG